MSALSGCDLTTLPAVLVMLTVLTHLGLSGNSKLAVGWQHLQPLTQLRDLDLSSCYLTALVVTCYLTVVPKQVSALTGLTRLDLSRNRQLHNDLLACGLTAVPEELSTQPALTSLDLSYNEKLPHGWQQLLILTQLQHLYSQIAASPLCQSSCQR